MLLGYAAPIENILLEIRCIVKKCRILALAKILILMKLLENYKLRAVFACLCDPLGGAR